MKVRTLTLGATVATAMSIPAAAMQKASDIGHRTTAIDRRAVDALFSQFTRDSPGCAVGVFKDGSVAFARGYGMASLEHDVPITPDSVFYAGSVSKQFTASAAALAIKQGKLASTRQSTSAPAGSIRPFAICRSGTRTSTRAGSAGWK